MVPPTQGRRATGLQVCPHLFAEADYPTDTFISVLGHRNPKGTSDYLGDRVLDTESSLV